MADFMLPLTEELTKIAAQAAVEGIPMFSFSIEIIISRGKGQARFKIGSEAANNTEGHEYVSTITEFFNRVKWARKQPPSIILELGAPSP